MCPHDPRPPDDDAAGDDAAAPAPSEQGGAIEPAHAPGLLARLGIGMVRGYQRYISPMTPPSCRYQPTCSQYTLIAIRRYGFARGCWMGAKRIARCHPFHPGGYDPVP